MTGFPKILDRLLDGGYLTGDEAEDLMDQALQGDLGPERLAALVTALRAKSPAVDELVGFARSMRRHAAPIDVGAKIILDTCGTGGAPQKAFNVSTTAAFALAAAGITVAKHGNRSVTRPSGSADVLEQAGADLDASPAQVEATIRACGIGFLFAPAFHPAMKYAGPVRQALGIKTVFNLLGPLTNPAGATHQVLGVYDPALVPPMARSLARLGCQGGYVLHGEPGFDEATPCGPVQFVRIEDGEAGGLETVAPEALSIVSCGPDAIGPVPAEDAPDLMRGILSGQRIGPRAETVALNMAFALTAVGKAEDLADGVAQGRELLRSGAGITKLDAYLAATQEVQA